MVKQGQEQVCKLLATQLAELGVPVAKVNGTRQLDLVVKSVDFCMRPYVHQRNNLLERWQSRAVDPVYAAKLVSKGLARASRFGRFSPMDIDGLVRTVHVHALALTPD